MWMYEYVHVCELRSTCMDNFSCVSCQCRQGEEVISQGRASPPSIFNSLLDLLQLLDPRRPTARIVRTRWRAPAGPKPSLGHIMWLDLSQRRSDYPGEWKAFKSPHNSWAAGAWHCIFHSVWIAHKGVEWYCGAWPRKLLSILFMLDVNSLSPKLSKPFQKLPVTADPHWYVIIVSSQLFQN